MIKSALNVYRFLTNELLNLATQNGFGENRSLATEKTYKYVALFCILRFKEQF